jgi:hypothetical protein
MRNNKKKSICRKNSNLISLISIRYRSKLSMQHILFFFRNFPTYMRHGLLKPPHLLISEKSAIYTVFLQNKFQKIPTYTPLLKPPRLFYFGHFS